MIQESQIAENREGESYGNSRDTADVSTERGVEFYSIDYVGTVADYYDPDPNLMRGDGMRQRWPPGALEKIRLVRVRR